MADPVPAGSTLRDIEKLVGTVCKKFGDNALMRMTVDPAAPPDRRIPVIPTGSVGLDRALGVGGLPRGRIVEIYGPESSGKTTLTLHVIAEAQKLGGICAFVDAEHALDMGYAEALGVDADRLLLSQPDWGEQALEIVDEVVDAGTCAVVVVDSVAALTPKAEIEGDMGAFQMGSQARLMSQALRKLCAKTDRTGTLVIFINQMRMKIGVIFGNPETTPGGNALKFYASVRLDVRRIGKASEEGKATTGNKTRVKVVKNKVAPPFREAEFDITWGKGIDTVNECINLGVQLGVLKLAGAWYWLGEERLGNGIVAARKTLHEHPDFFAKLRAGLLSVGTVATHAPAMPVEQAEEG